MLSGIVITKNEEKMIGDCLLSLTFCDQILVVDNGNTDATNEIAKQHGAKIVKSSGDDYSQVRNDGLKAARGEWILYVDADERVTPLLKEEIKKIMSTNSGEAAYEIPRRNIYLGREMHYGGWGHDKVVRLFKKSSLQKYINPLHEQPVVRGSVGRLENELVHFSHRDLTSMVEKTLVFTQYEAQLRVDAKHPPVAWWRFVRVMLTEFRYRFIKLSAWKDGVEGVIDGLFQVFNTFIIYARVWEIQHHQNESRNL